MLLSTGEVIGQSVTWASIAATTFMVVFKGLPKFLEIYTASQESIRKTLLLALTALQLRVDTLENTLEKERSDCERRIGVLWERIEKMRLIIVRRIAANPYKGRPLEGALKHAYGDPFLEEVKELLIELEVPLDGTGFSQDTQKPPADFPASPAAASEPKQGPKV